MRKPIAAALLTVAFVASGCGAVSEVASLATPEPRDVLLAAVPDEDTERFRFSINEAGLSLAGVVDPASPGLEMSTGFDDPDLEFDMDVSFLILDQETFVRVIFSGAEDLIGLPELPEEWMLVDRTRIEDPEGQGVAYDVADVGNTNTLFWAIVDVEETEPGHYRGTLDLTETMEADIVSEETVTALGDAAPAVPFTAEIDDSDRLVAVTVEVPGAGSEPAYDYEVRYFDYGVPEAVTAPDAADVVEAPPAAYDLLNG